MAAAYRAEAHNTAASASVVVTKPAGTVDGDVLVAFAATDFGFSILAAPAGWVNQSAVEDSSSAMDLYVWTKLAASEPANYTFTSDGGGTLAATVIAVSGGVLLLGTDSDGVDIAENTSGTSIVTPTVTTTVNGDLILRAEATKPTSGVASATWPTSAERNDFQQASGKIQLSVATLGQTSAGATGTETSTVAAGKHVAITIAIAASPSTSIPPMLRGRQAINRAATR